MNKTDVAVLIVDDDLPDLEIAGDYLGEEGYQLVLCACGEKAWELLLAEPGRFSAVVLDRLMPRLGGMELLQKIKHHDDLQMLPVIMQSGLVSNQEISEALRAGAYFYIAKPFEKDLLNSAVAAAVADFQRIRSIKDKSMNGVGALKYLRSASFQFQSIEEAKELAAYIANSCPFPEKVAMGLTELLINSVEHGNLSIGYNEKTDLIRQGNWLSEVSRRLSLPENTDKFTDIDYCIDTHGIKITISDCGDGFEWENYVEFDSGRLHDNHGRGIAMANQLSFDSLQYLGTGNQVEVRIKI